MLDFGLFIRTQIVGPKWIRQYDIISRDLRPKKGHLKWRNMILQDSPEIVEHDLGINGSYIWGINAARDSSIFSYSYAP